MCIVTVSSFLFFNKYTLHIHEYKYMRIYACINMCTYTLFAKEVSIFSEMLLICSKYMLNVLIVALQFQTNHNGLNIQLNYILAIVMKENARYI